MDTVTGSLYRAVTQGMMTLIVNETAGGGEGARALRGVTALLEARGIPFEVCRTTASVRADALARAALDAGQRDIVCIGGDGTTFETVNGIAGRPAALYFVPCGTGNDFVRMLELPKDPVEAFRVQLDGAPRRIDVGRVNEYWFLNVSGSGFDVEVLVQAARFKRFGKGLLPYLLGILAAIRKFRPPEMEITIDGQTERKRVTIVSIGNGRYIGGGMKAVPHARVDDGLFDVIIGDALGRLKILVLLSKFISGKHTTLSAVREVRCRQLTLKCPGMTVDLDGELIQMDEARYELRPGALEIHAQLRD